MVMKPGTKTITFRVPEEMYFQIAKEADKEERSMNNFIAYVVKQYIESNKKSKK